MKEYFLSEIYRMMSGGTPRRGVPGYYNGKIPWVKISDIENAVNGVINYTEELITQEGLDSINNRIFDKGTLLLAIYGSVGKVAIAGCQLSTNQAILGIKPKDNSLLNIPFFKYWFESRKSNLMNQFQGVALKNISATIVKRQKIRLPILSEQKQIVKTLDTADTLRQKRKEQLNLLDDYLKSVFFEMFGDPVSNNKRWNTAKINDVIENIVSGWSVSGELRQKTPDEYGVLKISAVTYGIFKPDEYKAVNKDVLKKKMIHPLKGDILFSRANTRELVGASCLVDGNYHDLFLPDKLWKIVIKDDFVNPVYFQKTINNSQFRSKLAKKATGTSGSMLNISKEKFISESLILPPKKLQNKFASIVEQVEQTKQKMCTLLDEMDNHFNALMQRYFG